MKHKREKGNHVSFGEPLSGDGNLSVSGRLGLRLAFHGGF